MKMMWCSECNKMVAIEEPVEGHSRIQWFDMDTAELMWCDGPFFDCEPETDPDWDVNLPEPDGDEMFIINRNAELLLNDFEG